MKIIQNQNELYCNPSTPEDIEQLAHFSELNEIETINVSMRTLEKDENYYHSHAGVFHGWMLDLQRSGKNVIVITKNKAIGGIFNYINSIEV